MADDLQQYLDSLNRDDCYLVDAVLKEGALERTERVFFAGANGGKLGPFVRKTYRSSDGVGAAWQRVMDAQRAGARFVHLPRIVDCYELGEECAVVMEFVRGETLEGVVRARGASGQLARELFPGACDAVSELHGAFDPQIIHRDIKPSNLMLSGDEVVLIDLGIARTFDRDAVADTAKLGTRGFAPPEQFGFGQTDVRSDVYALGMLLFYLLTGSAPEPLNVGRVMCEQGIAQEVRAVVLRATAFDPASRYATTQDLKQAFLQVIDTEVVGDAESNTHGDPEGDAGSEAPSTEKDERREPPSPVRRLARLGLMNRSAAPPRKPSPARRLSRLGLVWDIALAAVSAFFLVVCILLFFFPGNELADAAPLPRAVQLAGIWALLLAPAIALCDPRPLARLLPRFAQSGFLRRLGIAVVVALVAFVTVGISAAPR